MNGRYNYDFGSIWSTWSLDRLFIVDELANAKRAQAIRKGSKANASISPGKHCNETDRTGAHVREGDGKD